jgi:hypothetical protein
MENKSKIVLILSLVLLVICCKDKKKQTITEQLQINGVITYNLGRLYIENNQLTFEAQFCLHSDFKEKSNFYVMNGSKIKFTKLIDLNLDTISLGKIVDSDTFHLLGLDDEEKQKIRNPYYFDGRMYSYYADKNFTYVFADKSNPEFKVIGESDKAVFIGGDYLKLGVKIYSNGIEVKGVDCNSFKSFEVHDKYRLQYINTIGSDKKHLFWHEKIMTKNEFIRILAPNDSLEKKYFR